MPVAKKKAPAKKAAAKPQETISMKMLAARLHEDFTEELTKKDMDKILSNLVEDITGHLADGNKVRIPGLGILQVKNRAARMGRNPATGESIKIKASKKVSFRASKELKEAVI